MHAFSFCWKIPTTTKSHFDLLCGGYVRPLIPLTAYNNIKDLCMNYLNNNNILSEIKNAKPGTSFRSPIFNDDQVDVVNGPFSGCCKWSLQFYPSGTERNIDGYSAVRLTLISLSSLIAVINCQCDISIPEINYSDNHVQCSFNRYTLYREFDHNENKAFQLDSFKHLKILTFNLKISNLNIEYHKDEMIPNNNKLQLLSTKHITDNFKWKVNTERPESLLFKMHSLSWCLQLNSRTRFQAETGELCMELVTIPPDCYVFIYYNLVCKDIGYTTSDFALFRAWSLVKTIRSEAFLTKNICNFKFITIDLMITLIDIFDKNGNNITNRYIDNHKPAQKLTFSPSSHYKWKIPAISSNDALFLCNGYIREKCMNIYIPFDISQLIILFFDDGKHAVDEIKNAKNSVGFKSDIFKIEGIKFYLDLYPRGYDTGTKNIESYLNMVSLSANILGITCWHKWRMCEVNIFNEDSFRFSSSTLAANISGGALSIQHLQNVESLTFELDLYILGVFDQNACLLDNYHKYQDTNIVTKYIDSFEWKIDGELIMNQESVISDEFDMHSLKWNLTLITDDDTIDLDVKLTLISLPSNIRIWVNIVLKCEDINFMQQSEGIEFSKKNMEHEISLSHQMESNKDITFILILELMDVYDKNGCCMTDKYIAM